MATENNNKVDNNSNDAPSDLSYKSENIVGSKSRTRKNAEFGETKLSASEKADQRARAVSNKLKSIDRKKVNLTLVAIIILLAIGCTIGVIALVANNNNPSDIEEVETDEVALAEENEGKDEITAARAEAEEALAKNPNDCAGAAKGYVERINDSFAPPENNGVAEALIDDAEEYFANVNPSTCSLLAVYTGIDYDMLDGLPGLQHYFKRIIVLADEIGDNDTKAKWEPIYEAAAAGDDDEGDREDYYNDDPTYYDLTIDNTSEGEDDE